jgi:hypothetical protein
MDRRYLDAFVVFWDGHRRSVGLDELAVLLNAAALLLTTVWLWWFRHELPQEAAWLLRVVQVSAVVSLALVPVTWIPPQHLPVPLLVLMPGRVLNIAAMTYSAILLGLLGASKGRLWSLLLLLMAAALLIGNESMLWRLLPGVWPDGVPRLDTDLIAFVVTAALLVAAAFSRTQTEPVRQRSRSGMITAGTLVVLLSATIVAYTVPEPRSHIFIDRTNNPVLAAAAAGDGLLLTVGEAHLMQLRTRRPGLIDTGALDTIPYTPGSGPVLDRILRDIYGIDLFDPPPELRHEGRLLQAVHREQWQRFTREDWRRIRERYHVVQVLTPADWQLSLPIVAGDHRFLLHDIPQ